ncbi:hypothetical protein CTA1_539 [Colletotrichum tanaceti]|uniref:Uncharacterized protein n=1 Tax=Colletotrichum tanaceti TaxID=1306861 RepID=A0A4U6X760_9PEZI|nr:hypothetical protein CTA1_539 [Colletotrichum tanaceti]
MSKMLDEVSWSACQPGTRQTILMESWDLSDPGVPGKRCGDLCDLGVLGKSYSKCHTQDPTEDSSISKDVEQLNAALDEAAGLIK